MVRIQPRLLGLLKRLEDLKRIPRVMVWLVQLCIFVLSGLAAFMLRFDFSVPAPYLAYFIWALPTWLIAKAVVFRSCGLDRDWWRFVSVDDVFHIGLGNFLGSSLGAAFILTVAPKGFPRSLYILDFLICLLLTSGVRVFTRIVQDSIYAHRVTDGEKAVLIYGAGAAGVTLLREIRSNATLHYRVLGFVDDNIAKHSLVINGTKVLGTGAALAALVSRYKIEEVLIALPSATGEEMRSILSQCHQAHVCCRTIPALSEMIEGRTLANQIRGVNVEDLLGRKPVRLEEDRIRAVLDGKVVLVTGAAGSIGSELCRQIARFHPACIVGFDIAESPLFEIEREMRVSYPCTPFYSEIGSIQKRTRVDEVLRQHSPSIIYHAAAYKHVPLMEAHVFEAIENNILGTYNVAVAAAEHGVQDFVMISSDKAVNPTNIMGATKRVTELLLLALQDASTKYVAVRFGNVLESNGSVVPIFRKQIASGGPVTVMHPDMRRFFMTIPEACQLVLQASIIGTGGQICVLEMGEQVRIIDLARNMILLSGLRPDEDIKIEFTGVRPGEKLCEELSSRIEETAPTVHEKVRIYTGNGMPPAEMMTWLDCLRNVCETRDLARLVRTLKEIVPNYNPSAHLLTRLEQAGTVRIGDDVVSRSSPSSSNGTQQFMGVVLERQNS